MQAFNRATQKYDAATIFILVAIVVVIVELSLMRVFVPSSVGAEEIGSEILMEQMCTSEKLTETATEINRWDQQVQVLSTRLSNDPVKWQKKLVTTHAFGQKNAEEFILKDNSRSEFIFAANYAQNNLLLQSVMTGRTTLANINGNIYRVDDTISIRGGEIVLRIVELGSTYAVVQLDKHDEGGDTKRTIYLADSQKMDGGGFEP
jgi:hypothetical protein